MGGVRRGGGGGGLDMGMGMVMGGLRGLGDPGECIFRVVGGRGGGVIECVEAVYWWGRWMEGGGALSWDITRFFTLRLAGKCFHGRGCGLKGTETCACV